MSASRKSAFRLVIVSWLILEKKSTLAFRLSKKMSLSDGKRQQQSVVRGCSGEVGICANRNAEKPTETSTRTPTNNLIREFFAIFRQQKSNCKIERARQTLLCGTETKSRDGYESSLPSRRPFDARKVQTLQLEARIR